MNRGYSYGVYHYSARRSKICRGFWEGPPEYSAHVIKPRMAAQVAQIGAEARRAHLKKALHAVNLAGLVHGKQVQPMAGQR